MQKVLFDGRWIKVDEIDQIETSWGYDYSLYRDKDGRYYVTLCDGMSDVIEICGMEHRWGEEVTEDMAKARFRQYMDDLEKTQDEEW